MVLQDMPSHTSTVWAVYPAALQCGPDHPDRRVHAMCPPAWSLHSPSTQRTQSYPDPPLIAKVHFGDGLNDVSPHKGNCMTS